MATYLGSPKGRVCDKGLQVSRLPGSVTQGAGVRERKSETGTEGCVEELASSMGDGRLILQELSSSHCWPSAYVTIYMVVTLTLIASLPGGHPRNLSCSIQSSDCLFLPQSDSSSSLLHRHYVVQIITTLHPSHPSHHQTQNTPSLASSLISVTKQPAQAKSPSPLPGPLQ